jgi:NADPH:quinone reductase-like Zn-dependent oxidoreductase
MRAVVVDSFGSPDVLNVRDLPDPTPPPGGYVVEVVASSINYADVVERRGLYKKDQKLPSRLGKEAAGVVIARDADAVEFEVGDPVIIVCLGNGCYAEQVAVEAHEVLPPPGGLSFVEMASFAIAYTTAWYGMFEIANVRRGEAVLIQAAAGGVGSAAIDLARSHGCGPIIGTAGGPVKCATAVARGADACVDYSSNDFRPTVLELTGGTGVDYCLESVGGESYTRSIDVIAPMGHLVIIGFSSIGADYANAIRRLHPLTLFQRSISVGGLNLDNLGFAQRRGIWATLVAHAEKHGIRPLVTQVFPFEQIRQAHLALETRQTTGKVALAMDSRALDVPASRSSGVLV